MLFRSPIPPYSDMPYKGGSNIRNLKELKVGGGDDVLIVNKEGLFMGADNFTDAPFSVDYDGDIIANSITLADGAITTAIVSVWEGHDGTQTGTQVGTSLTGVTLGTGENIFDLSVRE